jgi:Tol biopolymer transport system component
MNNRYSINITLIILCAVLSTVLIIRLIVIVPQNNYNTINKHDVIEQSTIPKALDDIQQEKEQVPEKIQMCIYKIAFINDSEGIKTINSDGTEQYCIIKNIIGYPSWSFNGNLITVADMSLEYNALLYIVNRNGENLREHEWLHVGSLNNWCEYYGDNAPIFTARWSPIDNRIAFCGLNKMNSDIYITATDDENSFNQYKYLYSKSKNLNNITNGGPEDWYPIWSNDGESIYYLTNFYCNHRWQAYDIAKININLEDRIRITNNNYITEFAISSNEKKIAYTGRYDSLYVANIDGTEETRIASGHSAVWSPDNLKLAFVSEDSGKNQIYVMNSDGTNKFQLTDNNANNRMPAWSADGNYIAFVSDRDGNEEIYLVDYKGNNQQRLTYNTSQDYYPIWAPK